MGNSYFPLQLICMSCMSIKVLDLHVMHYIVIMQTLASHWLRSYINISCHSSRPSLSPIPCVHTSYQLPPHCFSPSPLPFYSFWNHLGSSWTRFPYQVNEYLYQRGRVLQDLERIIIQSKQSLETESHSVISLPHCCLYTPKYPARCSGCCGANGLLCLWLHLWPLMSPEEKCKDIVTYIYLYIIFLQNISVNVYGGTQSC